MHSGKFKEKCEMYVEGGVTLRCSINLNPKSWPLVGCCRPETDELGPWKTLHVVLLDSISVFVTCEYLKV